MCVYMCMHEYVCVGGGLPMEVKRGHHIPWIWSYGVTGVTYDMGLKFKLESFEE